MKIANINWSWATQPVWKAWSGVGRFSPTAIGKLHVIKKKKKKKRKVVWSKTSLGYCNSSLAIFIVLVLSIKNNKWCGNFCGLFSFTKNLNLKTKTQQQKWKCNRICRNKLPWMCGSHLPTHTQLRDFILFNFWKSMSLVSISTVLQNL